MKKNAYSLLQNKRKTIPILSFPAAKLLGVSVKELVFSSDYQAKAMKIISEKCPVGASLSMMDLSVEAEAFGAKIHFFDAAVPTVEKGIIEGIFDAKSILVPEIGAGRTEIFIDAVKRAKKEIADIPVFCSVLGPYSLAGRLFDTQEIMYECYDNPDEVKILLKKATEFIIKYVLAFKNAGADGIILAEPAAGLLSPGLAEEFSMPYIKTIIDAVNSEEFLVCYHNCGDSVQDMLPMIGEIDADIIHLGNAVNMKKALEALPEDKIIMGNIDPVYFLTKTPDFIKAEVRRLFDECSVFSNFIISTGCDLPAASKWENIDAYFEAINELYP